MKSIYVIFIITIFSLPVYSQNKSKVRIGLKLSPELSTRIAGWEPGPGYSYTFDQLGFTNGIQVLISHLETGLYYYQQSVIENKGGYDVRYTPQFLHIPILWRQEFKNLYITVGPNINANLGVNKKIDNQTIPGTVSFTNGDDNGAPIAVGFQTSLGYSFKITDTMNFFTELRLGGIIHKYAPGTYGLGLGLNWAL